MRIVPVLFASLVVAAGGNALAQSAATAGRQVAVQAAPPAAVTAAGATAPAPLVIFFPSGGAAVPPGETGVLDRAARLFRDGNPLVMTVSGAADSVGSPTANLQLSQQRADAVFHELIARGIPAQRFQVLAKGITDPSVPTPPGTAEPNNRRVEISWR
jgi:OOP family OmpA-OmpF porin